MASVCSFGLWYNLFLMRDMIIKSRQPKIDKKVLPKRSFLYKFKKFFIPSFFIGHPNVWDNFNVLRKHPQFQPLRVAFSAWLIFTLTVGSAGMYAFIQAPSADAASTFSIKTGYYYGDGTPVAVTGLGFQPELVIVKSDTAAGQMVWKSSVMATPNSSYLGVATADNTESEITFTSDGFTVSLALEVNTNKV